MRWRVLPDRGALDPTTVAGVAAGVGGLAGRIDADLGRKGAAEVASDLPALLTRATSGTRSSSSGILLLDGQVIILGGYALIMVAAMVVERRRGTTAVLRVRGATTAQLLRLAATEAHPPGRAGGAAGADPGGRRCWSCSARSVPPGPSSSPRD